MKHMKEVKLSNKFLSKYDDFPEHMNAIGTFVYLRTYSRYLPKEQRRETWKETVTRSVQYNVELLRKHILKNNLPITYKELEEEAEAWFDAMFNLDQFLSGRTMWVGGAEGGVAEKFPLGNFNCSFIAIQEWEDLAEQFYLLLVGTGVGFKHTFKMAENIAPVRDNFTVTHAEYKNLYAEGVFVDKTSMFESGEKATIYVGDSKEGWVEAMRLYFRIITRKEYEHITEIHFNYDYVRESGVKLKTFGGTASGHIPLLEMFENIEKTIKNQIDPTLKPPVRVDEIYVKLRPIHVLDFGNFSGNNVQVGGVRRTAEIFLIDGIEDVETIFAKYGLNGFWTEEQFQRHEEIMKEAERLGMEVPLSAQRVGERKHGVTYTDGTPAKQFDTKEEAEAHAEKTNGFYMFPMNLGTGLHHRRMSNNSVAFKEKPPREYLHFIFLMQRAEGEPAFINLRELAMRRFRAMGIKNPTEEQLQLVMELLGMNPCAEILLWTRGVCNLTTINVTRFVKNGKLDLDRLLEAQRRSARAGLRMTLVELEIESWSERQFVDRLLGLSLTGWKDMVAQTGMNRDEERALLHMLKAVGREEADAYSKKLRVNAPLLTTTVKPEGTISQVAGGVSSGLHYAHSEYFIRRIRISANDPLAQAVLEHEGWVVNAEVGTEGETREEQLKNARTLVIDFPVYSGAEKTKDEVYVDEQFDTYFMFQEYSEHNSSNTIHLRPDEWERAEERVWNGWNDFVGVSFLAHDGGTYQLAPYSKCTKEEYETLRSKMQDFDITILQKFEVGSTEDFDIGQDGCDSGICPVR